MQEKATCINKSVIHSSHCPGMRLTSTSEEPIVLYLLKNLLKRQMLE